jgi:hypothetical protein
MNGIIWSSLIEWLPSRWLQQKLHKRSNCEIPAFAGMTTENLSIMSFRLKRSGMPESSECAICAASFLVLIL